MRCVCFEDARIGNVPQAHGAIETRRKQLQRRRRELHRGDRRLVAMLQRAPVSLPGTLDSVVSMYAPGVRSLLTPLLTMGSLASSLVDDLCILLFAIGLGVLFCHVWTRS